TVRFSHQMDRGSTFLPATQSPGKAVRSPGHREIPVAIDEAPNLRHHAKATTVLAGPGRPFPQFPPLDDDRALEFHRLDRCVPDVPLADPHSGGGAVLGRSATPAGTFDTLEDK